MNDQSNTAGNRKGQIEISNRARLPEKPVVSVLMVAYNHGPYLADAIEGVLMQQTGFPIELLIGEDCSTDNTREIALRYQREHPHLIRVITSERNVGAKENFRRIVSASRGEFLALCEGDDYWVHPGKLMLQVGFFLRDQKIGVVHSDYCRSIRVFGRWHQIDGDRCRKISGAQQSLQGDIFNRVFSNMTVMTCTSMYRANLVREYFDSNLFDPTLLLGDLPMLAYVASKSMVGYINEVTGVYRMSPNSATRSTPFVQLQFAQAVAKVYEDFKAAFSHDERFDHGFCETSLLHLALASFDAGRRNDFYQYLRMLEGSGSPLSCARMLRVRKILASSKALFWLSRPALRWQSSFRGKIQGLKSMLASGRLG